MDLKIFTNNIEESAKEQIDKILSIESFKENKIRIMPDVHAGAGCIIGIGKGNPDWNYSAPHGAGRVMSRKQAKETLSLKKFHDIRKALSRKSIKKIVSIIKQEEEDIDYKLKKYLKKKLKRKK